MTKTPKQGLHLGGPKDNQTVCHEENEYSNPAHYVQVGCDYFFIVDKDGSKTLIPWKFSQLQRDFSDNPSLLKQISRYYGLGCFPDNTDNYQHSKNGQFNTYCPPRWHPNSGDWPHIRNMMLHIFSEHYEYGLDYVQLLYTHPLQKLPIIVLVSRERSTGKTTFLNLLKEIFGGNMAFVTNDTLRSKFNSERASKLIVACDEAFLDKKEDSERLKALSTSLSTYIEYKGKDRFEIPNFAKIILCSNNVTDPVFIDSEETRYWVREIPSLHNDNPNYLEAMKKEIPAFLNYLLHRPLAVPEPHSRMWFDPAELRTPALERIVRACRPSAEIELAETLLDVMDQLGVDELNYTTSELAVVIKSQAKEIRDSHKIVCKQWRVPQASNKQAYDYRAPFAGGVERHYGRYYTFIRAFLEGLVPGSVAPAQAAPNATPGTFL